MLQQTSTKLQFINIALDKTTDICIRKNFLIMNFTPIICLKNEFCSLLDLAPIELLFQFDNIFYAKRKIDTMEPSDVFRSQPIIDIRKTRYRLITHKDVDNWIQSRTKYEEKI